MIETLETISRMGYDIHIFCSGSGKIVIDLSHKYKKHYHFYGESIDSMADTIKKILVEHKKPKLEPELEQEDVT